MLRVTALTLALLCAQALGGTGGYARRDEAKAEVHKLLAGGNPHVALSRLTYLGEQRWAAGELLRALPQVIDRERLRQLATVLAALGQPIAEAQLVEFTQADDSVLRMQGAIGLGRISSRRVAALLPLLEDPSLGVRREAARALGNAKLRKLGKVLLKAARAEGEPEVRAAMLVAAGRCADSKLAGELAPFLDSSSESTRFAAAQALCLLGAPRGFAFARELLGSEDRFVRRQGVALFEGLPAKKAALHLAPSLNDPDKAVAAAAARILYQGGDASKLVWLVLASHHAGVDDKLLIERELETLMITPERRRAILKKAGVK